MKLVAPSLIVVLLAVVCASVDRADAWGGEGHQIVALIAEAHLTPAAAANVEALLGKDSQGEQAHISDGEIANWADRIRRERSATGPYHYVDIPVEAKSYDAKRDGNDGNNVIDKVTFYENVLKDSKASADDRREAIKWVVHLVGDLHQPLHCAERDKDRGGNSRDVQLLDAKLAKPTNLHSVWDTGILRLMIEKQPVAKFAGAIDKRITPSLAKTWGGGTPAEWAIASHDVAVKFVYAGVPGVDKDVFRLDQRYVDRAKPVISEQLAKAGIRLATILNRDLAGPVVKTPVAAVDKEAAR